MAQADWSAPEAAAAVQQAAEAALAYLTTLPDRPVGATATHADLIRRLPDALPTEGLPATDVVAELLQATEGGIVATGSPRYHGFVIGGALPATVAADWLTTAWDQNAGLYAGGPAASVLEQVAAAWVLEALHLPSTASVAMVTGCQMAHVTCLAAARHRVLARHRRGAGQRCGLDERHRWRDQAAMRISVVNWQTGPDDVDRTIAAIASAVADLE